MKDLLTRMIWLVFIPVVWIAFALAAALAMLIALPLLFVILVIAKTVELCNRVPKSTQ